MRVPVYERQIGINPMPQPNIQPVMPTGDGGASAWKAIQGFADRVMKLQQDYEDTQTLEAFNKFKNDSLEYHENPDKGLYNTRLGGAAKGFYSEADGWMRTKGEEYAQRLGSNRAKANFRRMASDYISQRGQTNSRFEAEQSKKYRIETADASIKNDLAEIESNWNNPEKINQARQRIQQSLELKLRGSSRDAYRAAYADIEDKIGVARIRQAYTQDPLLAVSMLDHPDIHLKPETAAQLREHLKNKTEIYELQAIAQTFAQRYTPENSVQAYNNLIQMYGADKGNKAYAQLNRIWGISQSQKNLREQNTLDAQRKNENELIRRFMNGDLTEAEVKTAMNNESIRPSTAHTLIGFIKQEEQRAETEKNNALNAARKEAENKIWDKIISKKFPTDEELQELVDKKLIGRDFANWAIGQRKEYERSQAKTKEDELKSKQAETAHNFLMRTITPDAVPLTADEVRSAMEKREIDDAKGKSLLEYIKKQKTADEKEKRNAREQLLRTNAEDFHGFIPREKLRELQEKGAISDEFAAWYVGKENQYNSDIKREKEKQDKEAAKSQAEADKAARKQNLYEQALIFAKQYPTGQEQDIYPIINKIPVEDRDIVLKYYNEIVSQQRTGIKNLDQAHKELQEQLYQNLWYAAANNQWAELSPDKLAALKAEGAINEAQYNNLESMRKSQQTAQNKANEDKRKDDLYKASQDLFNRLGLGNESEAYQEINSKYSREDALLMRQYYDGFRQEATTTRAEQDRILREKQKQTENSLYQYWDKLQPVPNKLLRQYEQDNTLTREQLERAYAMNAKLTERTEIENRLARSEDWATLSQPEQEQRIMLQMGTNEEARRQNVTVLFQKLTDGILTNEEINWAWMHGRISSDDKENLKEFDNKFVKEQKALITRTANDMILEIKKLGIKNNSRLYENEALSDFYRAASTLDPHAKNFKEALESIYKSTLSSIQSRYGDTLKKGWVWEYPAETRLREGQERLNNYTVPENTPEIYYQPFNLSGDRGVMLSPQGETTDFTNIAPVIAPTPQPAPQPVTQPQTPSSPLMQRMSNPDNYNFRMPFTSLPKVDNPQNLPTLTGEVDLSRSFVDGNFRITSGYSITPTKLRNGRGHRAIDIGTPENTPLRIPNGYTWRVTSTGNNNTAGKHVTISTQLSNGNNVSVTFAHLKSYAVRQNDTLTAGDIFARTGNTGHSTGPHLHVSVKINGRTVNPLRVNMQEAGLFNPEFNDYSQQEIQPQPIVQPIVSSDAEYYQMALQSLGLGDNPLWGDISGDISSTSLYGGY